MRKLKRILHVEDEQDIREIVHLTFQVGTDLEIRQFSSGRDAVEQAGDVKPDILLLDLMMPGLDGIETYYALTEQYDLNNVPVIFMTAKNVRDCERVKSLGSIVIGIIEKPFEVLGLPKVITEIYQASAMREESGSGQPMATGFQSRSFALVTPVM